MENVASKFCVESRHHPISLSAPGHEAPSQLRDSPSVLRCLNAPPAHAWRRGWAVHARRNGVSEVSVCTIAGWSSGAMVARYTAALSNELVVAEFERLWMT